MFDRSPNIFAGCNAKPVSTNTNAITFVTPDAAPPHLDPLPQRARGEGEGAGVTEVKTFAIAEG